MKFRVGQRVWWLQTLGGGGGSGHRANPVEPRAAIIRKIGSRRVQITTTDFSIRDTWVNLSKLLPR